MDHFLYAIAAFLICSLIFAACFILGYGIVTIHDRLSDVDDELDEKV